MEDFLFIFMFFISFFICSQLEDEMMRWVFSYEFKFILIRSVLLCGCWEAMEWDGNQMNFIQNETRIFLLRLHSATLMGREWQGVTLYTLRESKDKWQRIEHKVNHNKIVFKVKRNTLHFKFGNVYGWALALAGSWEGVMSERNTGVCHFALNTMREDWWNSFILLSAFMQNIDLVLPILLLFHFPVFSLWVILFMFTIHSLTHFTSIHNIKRFPQSIELRPRIMCNVKDVLVSLLWAVLRITMKLNTLRFNLSSAVVAADIINLF